MTNHLDAAERALIGITGDGPTAQVLRGIIRHLRELSASPGDGDAKEPSPPERGETVYEMLQRVMQSRHGTMTRFPFEALQEAIEQRESRSPPEPASEGEPSDDELRVIYAEAQRMVVDLEESIYAARRALYNRGVRDGERKAKVPE